MRESDPTPGDEVDFRGACDALALASGGGSLALPSVVSGATAKEPECRAPLLEECPQHHGHKGDPRVTPGTCGTIGERAQVILV